MLQQNERYPKNHKNTSLFGNFCESYIKIIRFLHKAGFKPCFMEKTNIIKPNTFTNMSITLSHYLLSFSENTFSGTFTFSGEEDIQIMEIKLFQRIHQKYLIGQANIMSEIGLSKVDFSFPIKFKAISSHLHAKLSAKLLKAQDLINEEACSYQLKVQYMQDNKVYVVLFDAIISE